MKYEQSWDFGYDAGYDGDPQTAPSDVIESVWLEAYSEGVYDSENLNDRCSPTLRRHWHTTITREAPAY